MATFDFIDAHQLRQSLERDSAELVECMKVGAWKAVHVLAATIIQGTLTDHLRASGKADEAQLRELSGGDLLEFCREQRVLSPRTVDLSEHLRPYLSRIRSGSPLLSEAPADENAARIAQALVEIIVNEVAGQKRGESATTAERILARLRDAPESFRVGELQPLEETDRCAIKAFFFEQLNRWHGAGLVDAAGGMGAYLTSEREARAFFVPLVSALVDSQSEDARSSLALRIEQEYAITSPDNRRAIRRWIQRVKRSLARQNKTAALAIVQALESRLMGAVVTRDTRRRNGL
jgi:hypothetical protein